MRPIWLLPIIALAPSLSTAASPAHKPSIVFFLADDLGWGDVGCYGAKGIRTPHIDRMAAEGTRFSECYSNGPECSPTRAAFLTGRYQQRIGGLECAIGLGGVGRYDDAIRLAERQELGLPPEEVSIARMLKDAGYATALIGKWHLGYEDKFSPNRHGFDHALYALGGAMDYFHHFEDPSTREAMLRLNGAPLTRPGYFTETIAEECVRWLRERKGDQPLFLYVPFTAPHFPYQAPGEDSPEPLPTGSIRWKQGQSPPDVYAAMVESMDAAIGKILDALAATPQGQNALAVFASDNGGTKSSLPCGLRDQKGTTFEGGIRVPCIVRWPGQIPAGITCAHPALLFDLTASFARIAGAAPAAARPFDGIDILRYVASGDPPPHRPLFWRGRRGDRTWRAVRDGDIKYVSRTDGPKTEEFLFDIAADLGESQNLLGDRPADAARLKALLSRWEDAVRPAR